MKELEAMKFVIRIVSESTFVGAGAEKVAHTLEILRHLERALIEAVNEQSSEVIDGQAEDK